MQYIKKIILISLIYVWLPQSLFAQNVYVTATSGTSTGNYANLTLAFNAINSGTHKGTIAIRIDADFTAGATASISPSGSGSASYSSIYIYPNGARTITGNFNGPIITFNGADNVTINGINVGTTTLTLRNDYTGAYGHVALFQNGASSNSIRNCKLLASPYGYGIINFSTTDYNDNDSISGCEIGPTPAGGYPQVAVYGWGSGTVNYSSNNVVIYNNDIFDFRRTSNQSYGILIGTNQNNWKVYNNRFFQTTAMSTTGSYSNYPIYVSNSLGAVDIRNNVIGGDNTSASGTYSLSSSTGFISGIYPIYIASLSNALTSNIQGNTIKNIYIQTFASGLTFTGIFVNSGMVDIGNISGNTIGSSSTAGSILIENTTSGGSNSIYGILSYSSNVSSIKNNIIGGISMKYLGSNITSGSLGFYAISVSSGSSNSITNNIIGSDSVPNSIYVGPGNGYAIGTNTFYGIACGSVASLSVSGNSIQNISSVCNNGSGTMYPIYLTNSSSSTTCSSNTLKNINTAAPSIGIYLVGCLTNTISGNLIDNFSCNSTLTGIYSYLSGYSGAISSTITGNSISNISNCTSFNGITGYACNSTTINNNTIDSVSASSAINGIYAVSSTATTISGNTIFVLSSSSTMNGIYAYSCATTNIANNSIYSLTSSSTLNGIYAYYCTTTTVNNNSINNFSTGSSFTGIYINSCTGAVSLTSNSLTNISGSASSNTNNYGIYATGNNVCSIGGNSLSNLYANSVNTGTYSSVSITGIYLYSLYYGNTMYSNTISVVHNLNTSTANCAVGILYYGGSGATMTADIYGNKVHDISSYSSSGTAKGIYIYTGTSNVYNNFVSLISNLSNIVYGIHGYYSYTGQSINVYYNTVFISGSNSLNGESACLVRDYATITSKNNILYNQRSNNGNNYALSNSLYNNFNNFDLNYNLLVVTDTSNAIRLYNTQRGWYYYTTNNTNDKWSWVAKSGDITSSALFNNAAAGDLTINSSNPACWYSNGKGVPVSGYSTDKSGNSRSVLVSNGATDIGAEEFSPSCQPPSATHTGTLTAGSTSTYTFAGRTIAQINWQSGYSTPSSPPVVKYYTGSIPTAPVSSTLYFNCYWDISASPSTGYSYILKLFYGDNELGTLSTTPNLRMAKNHTGTTTGWACQCTSSGAGSTTVDAANRTITNVTPFTSFSIFTGTDVTNPLPVEFVSLDAEKAGDAVHVTWVTASEVNASHFIVERSYDGINFTPAGRTEASGTSNQMHTYHFYDHNADVQAATIFYRLKQVDLNEAFTYTPIVAVKSSLQKNGSVVTMQPNPFNGETHITFSLPQDEKVAVDVYDLTGRVIWSKETDLEKGEQMLQIPESGNWNKGTYILVIKGTSVNYSQKLIKF